MQETTRKKDSYLLEKSYFWPFTLDEDSADVKIESFGQVKNNINGFNTNSFFSQNV